ncbi:MAG: flavin reductase family protein [Candidatus Thermoplasmatota archaeon]|nr:flavin reductase family protein [Candidatus Thermoplasmatota archaeon]
MKKVITADDAQDAFSGFPVVLGTVASARDNIITLAMCHIFSFRPPLIGVGIGPRRFSHGLFRESRDFAVNIPNRSMLRAVEICGSKSGKNVDKFEAAGLTREKAERISAPLIAECPVNIECLKVKEVEAGDHTWFIGEVVAARKDESYDKAEMLLYWGEYRVIGDLVK